MNVFHIDSDFSDLQLIGSGTSGTVCRATLREQGHVPSQVAVKRIEGVFNHSEQTKRVLREVLITKRLRHDNVMPLMYVLPPNNVRDVDTELFNEIYIVSPAMPTDLNRVLRSTQLLSDAHVQFFMYQILLGLTYLHSGNIVHRDIKPSNILCSETCECRICDFGLARTTNNSNAVYNQQPMTEKVSQSLQLTGYVVSRYYRAPELLLGTRIYTSAIDMWSVGCILAELYTRTPVFPGKDFFEQVRSLLEKCGPPSEEELRAMMCADGAKQHIVELCASESFTAANWSELLPTAPPEAISLISTLLRYHPGQRLSAMEALRHPFFADLYDPADVVIMPRDLSAALAHEVLAAEVKDLEILRMTMIRELRAGMFQKTIHRRPSLSNPR